MNYNPGQKVVMKSDEDGYKTYSIRALACLKDSDYIFTIKDITDSEFIEMEENNMNWHNSQIKELYKEPIYKPINNRFEILDLQTEEGQEEEIKEEIWHLINPVRPIDEKIYDVKLKDGTVVENVEFWAFRNVFLYNSGASVSGRIVEFKERL